MPNSTGKRVRAPASTFASSLPGAAATMTDASAARPRCGGSENGSGSYALHRQQRQTPVAFACYRFVSEQVDLARGKRRAARRPAADAGRPGGGSERSSEAASEDDDDNENEYSAQRTQPEAVPVLYLYEIHCARSHRRLGLGTLLVGALEKISAATGMHAVMLTCLNNNTAAMRWYTRSEAKEDGDDNDDGSADARDGASSTVKRRRRCRSATFNEAAMAGRRASQDANATDAWHRGALGFCVAPYSPRADTAPYRVLMKRPAA